MDEHDLDNLARQVARSSLHACCGDAAMRLGDAILRLLVLGEPVTVEALAARVGRPNGEVETMLDTLPDLERDEDGRIVGGGLTLRPTPHRFETDGRVLFTWCALDALAIPPIVGRTARIESHCPATRTTIQMVVAPDGVLSVSPAGTAVSMPLAACCSEPRSVRRSFCDQAHFFRDVAHAGEWLRENPHGLVLPVRAAFRLAQRVRLALEADAPSSGSCEP